MNKKLRRTLTTALVLTGAVAIGLSAQMGGGKPEGQDGPPRLDLAAAAVTLNVTEEALLTALGLPEAPPEGNRPERPERPEHEQPDLAAAAELLGITEGALMAALGDPEQGRPDLAATAEALGISEEALFDALGLPERRAGERPDHEGHEPPEIDFAGAAETLGITEEALFEALGLPEGGPEANGPPNGGGGRR